MKIDTQHNSLLGYIYDLYDIVYNIINGNEPSITKKVRKSDCFGSWRDKQIRYPKLDDEMDVIHIFANKLGSEPPSFDTLWDFCEFIRIIEKVFFYRNEYDNYVNAEMKMDGSDNIRKLCIQDIKGDYEIRLTLERLVYESDIITITVVRKYGLEMQNTYTVVNGTLQFEDTSDRYLINEINFRLQDAIKTTFLSTVEQILKEGKVADLYE